MNVRLIRVLLAWLLLVALPLHGMAAAGAWTCHRGGPSQVAAAVAPAVPAAGAGEVRAKGHAHDAHHDGHHLTHRGGHPAHAPADGSAGAAAANGASADATPPASAHPCPACTSCGHALALPVSWPAVGGMPPPRLTAAVVVPAVSPAGWPVPDKPPRA